MRCRTRHIQIRTLYQWTVNRRLEAIRGITRNCFTFRPNERASIYYERVCEREYLTEYLQRNKIGNGFNKIMRTGNGFDKIIMYILAFKQEREILFEATRTCIWLKLDVCSMCVRFATQKRDTSGLINHQVKYFAKANSTFTIFLHRRHDRFIFYQFKTVSLFSNRDSKVTRRIPSLSSSSSSVTSPSSMTDSIALNDRIKRAFPFYR